MVVEKEAQCSCIAMRHVPESRVLHEPSHIRYPFSSPLRAALVLISPIQGSLHTTMSGHFDLVMLIGPDVDEAGEACMPPAPITNFVRFIVPASHNNLHLGLLHPSKPTITLSP